jgi:hypothetical protein
MKSSRNLATTILLALSTTLVFASANAQPNAAQPNDVSTPPSANTPATGSGSGQGRGMHKGMDHGMKGQRSEMSKLMTPEERTEMRSKMQAAQTPEERQALRTSMRTEMQKRAQEKGISMPAHPGGRQQQNCHQAG